MFAIIFIDALFCASVIISNTHHLSITIISTHFNFSGQTINTQLTV